jgi:hypothetical protein
VIIGVRIKVRAVQIMVIRAVPIKVIRGAQIKGIHAALIKDIRGAQIKGIHGARIKVFRGARIKAIHAALIKISGAVRISIIQVSGMNILAEFNIVRLVAELTDRITDLRTSLTAGHQRTFISLVRHLLPDLNKNQQEFWN